MLQIEPNLQVGDKVEWLVDGTSYQKSASTQIVSQSLDRGEHRLQVKLLDANNQNLMMTATAVSYVHYAMVGEASKSGYRTPLSRKRE